MRPDEQQAPHTGGPLRTDSAGETPGAKTSRPHRNPTQYDRVIRALMEHDEVCGHRTFYGSMMIPRFSAHLTRARKAGLVITKRPCDLPDHNHEGTGWLYRLEYVPRPAAGKPCAACGGILAHVSTCPARSEDGTLPGIGGDV